MGEDRGRELAVVERVSPLRTAIDTTPIGAHGVTRPTF